MITLTLNEKQIKALKLALDELSNSCDWYEFLSEEEHNDIWELMKLVDEIKFE